MRAATSTRLPAIDALRGIAVLAVLLRHLPFSLRTWTTPTDAPSVEVFSSSALEVLKYGEYGVHLFLVISGFCIHMAWAKGRDSQATLKFGDFWKRRLHRLYPPYFLALCGTLFALALHQHLRGAAGASLGSVFGYPTTGALLVDLVALLLLAQNINGASARIGNGPFWSLALEEQLYALYFAMFAMRRRWGWAVVMPVVLASTVAWRLAGSYVLPAGWTTSWFVLGPARWFEWALGALAVEIHLGLVEAPTAFRKFSVGLPLLAVAVTKHQWAPSLLPWTDDLLFGFAFFVLLNAACLVKTSAFEWPGARLLVAIGTMSYSLYLIHEPILVGVKQAAVMAGLGPAGITVLRLLVPLLAAVFYFRFVERRFINTSRLATASTKL